MKNKLSTGNIKRKGQIVRDYRDWIDVEELRSALVLIENYMTAVFSDLNWKIAKVSPDVVDRESLEGDKTRITVFTNACDDMFQSVDFLYSANSDTLIAECEKELIDYIRLHTYMYTIGLELLDREDAFFAIYDECDREDGNPLYQVIKHSDLLTVHNVSELLSLAGTYEGDGCLEVRLRDNNGEENVWVYMDNNGYKIMAEACL